MKPLTIKFAGIAVALALSVALSSCLGHGQDMTYAEGQEYLKTHQSQLRALIAVLETCRPVAEQREAYVAIQAEEADVDQPVCTNDQLEQTKKIRQMLRDNSIRSTDFKVNSLGKVTEARFLLYRFGLGVYRGGTWIVYEATPADDPPIRLDQHQELRPLDASPHHWFWVKA